jgi:hypothetical protein
MANIGFVTDRCCGSGRRVIDTSLEGRLRGMKIERGHSEWMMRITESDSAAESRSPLTSTALSMLPLRPF